MSKDFIAPPPDPAAERMDASLGRLLRASAHRLLADPDVAPYLDWIAREGAQLFPELMPFAGQGIAPPPPEELARLWRLMGWRIAQAMPLPALGWQPRPLVPPAPGEPCLCGSGRRFAQCCAPLLPGAPSFDADLLGGAVVQMLPRRAWDTLPASAVSPGAVLQAALALHHEGHLDAALKLLEPWARQPPPWPDSRAELLDLLGDLYAAADKLRKRRQLADAMIAHGAPAVQAKGWQRLSLLAADAGRDDEAREALERAQRLAPDDPALALLEVTTLVGCGEMALAGERARFHARRLARLPQAAELEPAIAMLEALAEDAPGAMAQAELEMSPELGALHAWLQALPAPALQVALPGQPVEDLGELKPSWAAVAPLREWRKVFAIEPPQLTRLSAPGAERLLAAQHQWLPLLRARAVLADCFEVLDDLVLMLGARHTLAAHELRARLLQRALALWAQLLEQQPYALCEWGWLGNRPALRLLVQHIEDDATPTAEVGFPWLRRLVEVLNPNDNHGLRERLAAVYLRRGDSARALALCERYPEDGPGMELLRSRALWDAGRREEAEAALRAALDANRHLGRLLTAEAPPERPDAASYRIGSVEDAGFALAPQADLWFGDAALRRWAQQVVQRGG